MPRIKITRANEVHELPVSNGKQSAVIPIDGKFHHIHDDLLPVLEGADVGFIVEHENAAAPSGSDAAEGAAGLGSTAASSDERLHAIAGRIEDVAARLHAAAQ